MKTATIRDSQGSYTLLDFSRIATLAEVIGLDIDTLKERSQLELVSSVIMEQVSAEVSGVIVDPEFDFNLIQKKKNGTGLVLSLEKKSDAVDPMSVPILAPNWGIEHIANNYALAKLELYYHPQEPEAMRKKQFVAEIYDYCKYVGIDLLLELLVYHPASEQPSKEVLLEAQLESAREFANSCDLFGFEYLGDPLSCVTLTAETDMPWLYNARGVGYEVFKQNLRVCIDSGAHGFMAGDPFWFGQQTTQGFALQQNTDTIQTFTQTILRDKVIESVRIVKEGFKE